MRDNKSFGYLNGVFDQIENLKLSVMDRGFLFGDGCYEVIPVYHKKPFGLNEHLERLNNNLFKIEIPFDVIQNGMLEIIDKLLKSTSNSFEYIYLHVTRGTYPVRGHVFPGAVNCTVFAYVMPFIPPNDETAKIGLKATTSQDMRWGRCDIKSISLLANVLLRQKSQQLNADETILLKEGYVTEGAISNVFIVKSNVVATPILSNHLLPGITRAKIIEILRELSIQCEERLISESELRSADEIWLTSSTREVMPVSMLDNALIFDPSKTCIWQAVFTAYQSAHG